MQSSGSDCLLGRRQKRSVTDEKDKKPICLKAKQCVVESAKEIKTVLPAEKISENCATKLPESSILEEENAHFKAAFEPMCDVLDFFKDCLMSTAKDVQIGKKLF